MSWKPVDFTYMPTGSYTITPDKRVLFWENATPELQERFMREWPDYVRRIERKHAEGRYDSSDLI